ncbi:MAG TPA: fasciclin domain-containing protein [Blastocatellia bacterium]|nr:fasciclin domain-containing protein [Blastocatellia bacterium]
MKFKNLSLLFVAMIAAVTVVAVFAQEPLQTKEAKSPPAPTMNIIDTTKAATNFTTFTKAVEAAGLTDTLNAEGPYTIFAPTDEAFAKLPAGTLDSLMANKEELQKLLLHHVVSGKVMAKDVATMQTAKSMDGSSLKITAAGGKVAIENAKVVQPDIAASNGVIHAIDTVLIPSK